MCRLKLRIQGPSSPVFPLGHSQPVGWITSPGSKQHEKAAMSRSRKGRFPLNILLKEQRALHRGAPEESSFMSHWPWLCHMPILQQQGEGSGAIRMAEMNNSLPSRVVWRPASLVTLTTWYQHQNGTLSQEDEKVNKQQSVNPLPLSYSNVQPVTSFVCLLRSLGSMLWLWSPPRLS